MLLLCTVTRGDSHAQDRDFWSLSGQNEGSQLFLEAQVNVRFETCGLAVLSVALEHFYRSEMVLWNRCQLPEGLLC